MMIDLCASMQLGVVQLEDYFDLPERFGDLYIKGNDRFYHSKTKKRIRLKMDFIKEVYSHLNDSIKSTYYDIYIKEIERKLNL